MRYLIARLLHFFSSPTHKCAEHDQTSRDDQRSSDPSDFHESKSQLCIKASRVSGLYPHNNFRNSSCKTSALSQWLFKDLIQRWETLNPLPSSPNSQPTILKPNRPQSNMSWMSHSQEPSQDNRILSQELQVISRPAPFETPDHHQMAVWSHGPRFSVRG